MKKWVIITCVILFILIGISVNIYVNAVEPINDAEEKAMKIAKEHSTLQQLEDFHVFYGSESYYILKGTNSIKESIIVWISESDKKVIEKKANDGITMQEAINKLMNETNPKKIVTVRLGMEKNIPLWEIYYQSEGDLMNYYYVDFETGEWLKRIENL